MKVSIDTDVIEKSNLTFYEFLLLWFIRQGGDVDSTMLSLTKKEAVVKDMFNEFYITQRFSDELDNILLSSDTSIPKDADLLPLAEKMMSLMPQCKKEGTSYFYKCNKREVVLKLKKFFKLYGKYSAEEVLDATRRYVESFNGDYTYMKLLKYFIMKDERRTNAEGEGYIDEVSILATFLENKDSVEESKAPEFGELV